MHRITRVKQLFTRKFGYSPSNIAREPGRVNLLGEHVDYYDGFILPAAIDRATFIAFSPFKLDQNSFWSVDFGQQASFSPQTLKSKTQSDGSILPDWEEYPAGVAWSLSEKALAVRGLSAVFLSDVPRGAGLSSSASVELVFALAWMTIGGWKSTPMELALLSQKAENKFVGVNCGIMDQFASACGEKGRLLLLDCRSLKYQTLPLPENVVIIIADTNVRHSHNTDAYNDRRTACVQAVQILVQDLPNIKSLLDVSFDDLNRLDAKLPVEVGKRARHIVEEIDRTNQAVKLLNKGDIEAFGQLMNECHASLRDLYEISCPEMDVLARIAQSLEGCYGARITEDGFGGCRVNLVAREKGYQVSKTVAAKYESEAGLHPEIDTCHASSGASLI